MGHGQHQDRILLVVELCGGIGNVVLWRCRWNVLWHKDTVEYIAC